MSKSRYLILCMFVLAAAHAAAQFPLQPGEAVLTCFSDNKGTSPVVAVFDIRNQTGAPLAPSNWALSGVHLPQWNLSNVKREVFGIALDNAAPPNIYLTTTVIYPQMTQGGGEVFKIDGTSGNVTTIATLPNTGEGLGNIAYDPVHDQLFVTNFRDGKIHRLSTSGATLSTFDPFAQFNSSQVGPAPIRERIWGVGFLKNKVYFSRWNSDAVVGSTPNQIYSVALDSSGGFTGPEQLEVTLPASSMPIADIEFTGPGSMLLAARGMNSSGGGFQTVPHQSSVYEYAPLGTSWSAVPQVFPVGGYSAQTNAAGGVAWSCPSDTQAAKVIATGDALDLTGTHAVYGFQITPEAGPHTVSNSIIVDADGDTQTQDKTQIGDVDVYNTCDRQCAEIVEESIICAGDGTGDYIVKFRIHNLSNLTIYHSYLSGFLSGVTASPDHFVLNGIAPGGFSPVLQTRIHGGTAGQTLTYTVSIHEQNLDVCCSIQHTITLPDCNCAQVIAETGPSCKLTGGYTYSFTL